MAKSPPRLSTMVDELEQLLEAALAKKQSPAPQQSAARPTPRRDEVPDDAPRITGTGAPAVKTRSEDDQPAVQRTPSGTLHGVPPVSPSSTTRNNVRDKRG